MDSIATHTETVKPQSPEATHSVNLFFKVEGYERDAQATGRGATAPEAAQNLLDVITETRRLLAPPVPNEPMPVPAEPPVLSFYQRLSRMVACGLEKAWARGDEALEERLIKAERLVRACALEATDLEGAFAVRSLSNPETWYNVDGKGCSCPDHKRHVEDTVKYHCKHSLAMLMFIKLNEPQ